jgi:hypothetical protein
MATNGVMDCEYGIGNDIARSGTIVAFACKN